MKYTHNGDTVWSRRYNQDYDDEAMDIAIDGSANLVVAGFTFNGLDYDFTTIKYSNAVGILEKTNNELPFLNYKLQVANIIKHNLAFNMYVTNPDWFDINLYDITGKKTIPIHNGNLPIGEYKFNQSIPIAGLYFLTIKPSHIKQSQIVCKKIIAIK